MLTYGTDDFPCLLLLGERFPPWLRASTHPDETATMRARKGAGDDGGNGSIANPVRGRGPRDRLTALQMSALPMEVNGIGGKRREIPYRWALDRGATEGRTRTNIIAPVGNNARPFKRGSRSTTRP